MSSGDCGAFATCAATAWKVGSAAGSGNDLAVSKCAASSVARTDGVAAGAVVVVEGAVVVVEGAVVVDAGCAVVVVDAGCAVVVDAGCAVVLVEGCAVVVVEGVSPGGAVVVVAPEPPPRMRT